MNKARHATFVLDLHRKHEPAFALGNNIFLHELVLGQSSEDGRELRAQLIGRLQYLAADPMEFGGGRVLDVAGIIEDLIEVHFEHPIVVELDRGFP